STLLSLLGGRYCSDDRRRKYLQTMGGGERPSGRCGGRMTAPSPNPWSSRLPSPRSKHAAAGSSTGPRSPVTVRRIGVQPTLDLGRWRRAAWHHLLVLLRSLSKNTQRHEHLPSALSPPPGGGAGPPVRRAAAPHPGGGRAAAGGEVH